MINIASSQPVNWPISSSAVVVAPVAAVGAVAPVKRSSGEGQSALGSERQAQHARDARQGTGGAQGKTTESPQAAPILPNAKAKDGQDAGRVVVDTQQQAQDVLAAEEARSEQHVKLLGVLSTVWEASAAVVEHALGLGDAAAEQSVTGPSPKEAVQPALPPSNPSGGSTQASDASGQPLIQDGGAAHAASEPPVAYTEQGASEWGALEMGRLVSKRA